MAPLMAVACACSTGPAPILRARGNRRGAMRARLNDHPEESEQRVVVRGIASGAVVVGAGTVKLGIAGVLQPKTQVQPRPVRRIELPEGHVFDLQPVSVAFRGGIGCVQSGVCTARRGEFIDGCDPGALVGVADVDAEKLNIIAYRAQRNRWAC